MSKENPTFLDFLVESSPRMEPPPFFATRVASLAERRPDLATALALLARRMAPVFMALSMVVCVFSYYTGTQAVEEPITYVELLSENEPAEVQVTWDELLASLAPQE